MLGVTKETLSIATTPVTLSRCYCNLGFYCIEKKDYDSAVCFYYESLIYADHPGVQAELHHIHTITQKKIVPPTREEVNKAFEKYGMEPGANKEVVGVAAALAKELDAHYFGRDLPHKFKFGVTGCQNNCLKAEENDVGIKGGMTVEYKEDACISCGVCVKACRLEALTMKDGKIEINTDKCNNCARCVKSCPTDAWVGTPGYIVSFGGTFGNFVYKGQELVPIIRDKDTLFRVTDAAINYFEENAKPSERFRKTLERLGEDELKRKVLAAYNGEA